MLFFNHKYASQNNYSLKLEIGKATKALPSHQSFNARWDGHSTFIVSLLFYILLETSPFVHPLPSGLDIANAISKYHRVSGETIICSVIVLVAQV